MGEEANQPQAVGGGEMQASHTAKGALHTQLNSAEFFRCLPPQSAPASGEHQPAKGSEQGCARARLRLRTPAACFRRLTIPTRSFTMPSSPPCSWLRAASSEASPRRQGAAVAIHPAGYRLPRVGRARQAYCSAWASARRKGRERRRARRIH